MGFQKMVNKIKRETNQYRFVMIGPDNSGKTTLTQKLFNHNYVVAPTFGYRIHSGAFSAQDITIVDVGGQKTFRKFWNSFFEGVDGAVFVFDLCDVRIDELDSVLNDNLLVNLPVLIVGNKMDLVSVEPADFEMKLNDNFNFFCCSAETGENVENAFLWLIENVNRKCKVL